jgi:hypothetical protein
VRLASCSQSPALADLTTAYVKYNPGVHRDVRVCRSYRAPSCRRKHLRARALEARPVLHQRFVPVRYAREADLVLALKEKIRVEK